jgi:hypothetical protein
MFFLKDITNNPGNFKFTKGSIKKFTIFLFNLDQEKWQQLKV